MKTTLVAALLIAGGRAWADCAAAPPEGIPVKLTVASCKELAGDKDAEVRKHAGPNYARWNLGKAYTGALLTDRSGARWMYPTSKPHPCADFPRKAVVEKRLYRTCCDSGRWGKCVFGGRFLGDLDGKPLNAFQ